MAAASFKPGATKPNVAQTEPGADQVVEPEATVGYSGVSRARIHVKGLIAPKASSLCGIKAAGTMPPAK